MFFYILCDIIVSFYIKSYQYFLVSLILPKEISSFENLLICLTDYDPVFKELLQFVSIYYFPVSTNLYLETPVKQLKNDFNESHFKKFVNLKNTTVPENFNEFVLPQKINKSSNKFISINLTEETLNFMKIDKLKIPSFLYHLLNIKINFPRYTEAYSVCHLPSFNITWFIFIHLFETYSTLIFNIININYIYCMLNLKWSQKFQFLLFFKPSSFKNYLLYFSKSRFLFLYLCFYFLYVYVEFLVYNVGISNPNFLNWISVLFIVFYIYSEKLK